MGRSNPPLPLLKERKVKMNRVITVNKKTYIAKPFDFNMLCDLEDMGVSLEKAQEKPMSMVRAYFAICTGKGKEFAGKEMEAHLINGGSFDDVVEAMSEEMNNSDFFKASQRARRRTIRQIQTRNRQRQRSQNKV